jgi:hypothetical protein
MGNKHYNKIIKLISKSNNLNERKSILEKYINRFNKSSYTHKMVIYKHHFLNIRRIDCDYYGMIEIDMSQYFDISIIRDNLIESVMS